MTDPAHLRSLLSTLDLAAVRELFSVTWHIFPAGPGWQAAE